MTWKPVMVWTITAARGFGAAFVSTTEIRTSYPEAVKCREEFLAPRGRSGVPPWDSVWVCEQP
jgi:hypothetical protein